MKLLVVGGTMKGKRLNDVEVLVPMDPNANCPKLKFNYPLAAKGTTGQLITNIPIVCGGSDYPSYYRICFAYNIKNGWKERSSMIMAREEASSVMINNTMWILGGYNRDDDVMYHMDSSFTTSELMSLETGKFSFLELPEQMEDHCTAAINVTHIFIASNSYNNKMAYLVDATKSPLKFTYIGPLSKSRIASGCGVASIGPTKDIHLIVAGGAYGDSLTTTEMYSLTEERWKEGL